MGGRHRRKPRLNLGRLALLVAVSACALGLAAAVGLVVAAARGLPSWRAPTLAGARASIIFDIHDRPVTPVPGSVHRQPLTGLDQAPPYVPQAFIAVEDRHFYTEPAVSPAAILRAAWQNLVHGRVVQGASTITQQLARNAFPIGRRRTLRRKLQEALLAVELGRHYSKDEILTMYLDDVYFGEGATGIRAASQTYFGHDVREDTLPQAALLAGLVQAPSAYDPYVHPRLALARRDTVLDRMARQGYIDAAQARDGKAQTLAQMGLRPRPRPGGTGDPYPWYVDAVLRRLTGRLHVRESDLHGGGLKIYTALDPAVQAAARQAVGLLDARFPAAPAAAQAAAPAADAAASPAGTAVSAAAATATAFPVATAAPTAAIPAAAATAATPTTATTAGAPTAATATAFPVATAAKARAAAAPTAATPAAATLAATGVSPTTARATPTPPLQVGLAVVQQRTGDVLALIGGRRHTRRLQFDRATQAERQPGSAIKPLAVYVPALASGMTAASVVDDVPAGYPDGHGGLWVPQNDGRRYEGLTTLREAVRRSVNVVAVKVLARVGVERGYATARRMGLVDLRPADRHLSLALGGTTRCCTPLEMADAYATIADGGIHRPPVIVREIVDAAGRVVYRADPRAAAVVSPQVAYVMTDILESAVEPQPPGGWDENRGTAARAAVPGWPTAGKTGTTSGGRDAWFAGFTPRLTAAVWVGYDRGGGPAGLTGGAVAAPIFRRLMQAALAGDRPAPFPVPPGIVTAPIDAKSGLLPGPLTPPAWVRQEVFVAGTQPVSASDAWSRQQVVRVQQAAGARGAAARAAGGAPAGRPGAAALALWDPGCPLPPETRVFLDRSRVTAGGMARLAAAAHVRPAGLVPADMALTAPEQTCTQALGLPGAPGGQPAPPGAAGGGGANPSYAGGVLVWQVTLSAGAPPSPATIEAPVGAPLRIVFTAASGRHHIVIPTAGVDLRVGPGQAASALLTPSRPGSYLIVDVFQLTRTGRLVVTPQGPAPPRARP